MISRKYLRARLCISCTISFFTMCENLEVCMWLTVYKSIFFPPSFIFFNNWRDDWVKFVALLRTWQKFMSTVCGLPIFAPGSVPLSHRRPRAWALFYTIRLVKSCYVAGRVKELFLFPLLFSGKVKKPGDNYCCAYVFRHTIPIGEKCLTLDK